MSDDLRERVARAICAEKCAFMGEPPCYSVEGQWPNPVCSEPGCHAEAQAAIDALAEMGAAKVKPLVWDDFEGQGAKASGFYQANYLITKWRGRGEFEVAMSYPGYQTGFDGERFHPTLEAAKAAAQADYEARILAALE